MKNNNIEFIVIVVLGMMTQKAILIYSNATNVDGINDDKTSTIAKKR